MAIILSSNLTKHDVRLIGRYEETSDASLPVFSRGKIVALFHSWGHNPGARKG